MPDPIDYTALAKQAGAISSQPAVSGTVDYSALAKQAGAIGSSPPPRSAVAPGTSDDDLIKHFGFDPAVIKASPRYQQAAKEYGSGVSYMLTNPAEHPQLQAWRNAPVVGQLEDVGMGAHDVLSGVVQLARHGAGKLGMLSDADVQYGDLLDRVRNQDYLENVRQGNASGSLRMLGNVLMPVPGGPEAKAGAGLLKQIGVGLLQGAKAAAVQPVESGAPGDFASEKLRQAGTGAVLGGGIAGTVGGLGNVAAKIINTRGVKLPEQLAAEAELATGRAQQGAEQATAQAQQGAEAANTRAAEAAAQANAQAQQMQDAALLTARGRQTDMTRVAEQRAAYTKAVAQQEATSTVERYKAGMKETPWGSLDDVTAAAESGDRHAAQVLEQVNQAGESPGRTHEASINLQNWRTSQQANQLYDKVQQLTDQYQLGAAQLPAAGKALAQTESQAKIGLRDKGLSSALRDIRDALTPPVPEGSVPLDLRAPRDVLEGSYSTTRKVISQLDEMIRSGRTGDNALISNRGTAALQQIKNGLEDDMQAFVKNSGVPSLQKAQEAADSYYRNVRVPFKDVSIAKAGTTDEADTIFGKFVQAGKGDRAQKFYDALEPKGQAAVQYNIVAKAFTDATDANTGSFDSAKFLKSLDKTKEAYGVFFTGSDRWEMEGLKNLLRQASIAGEGPAAVSALTEAGVKQAETVGKANVAAAKSAGEESVKATEAAGKSNVKATEAAGKSGIESTVAAGKASVDAVKQRLDKMSRYPLGTTAMSAVSAAEALRLGGLPGAAVPFAAVGAVAGSIKALLMTDAGKRFLLASSTMKPGSPAAQKLYEKILTTLPQVGAKAATAPGNERPPLHTFEVQ